MQSELTLDEQKRVAAFKPNEDLIEEARDLLMDACREIGLPAPDEDVVVQAAKIIGALGKDRIPQDIDGKPHKLWLLTEGYINAGKDPAPIHEAALSFLLSGTTPKTEAEKTEQQIEEEPEIDLGPLNEYVKLIKASRVGKMVGYQNSSGYESCNFLLTNGDFVTLMVNPVNIKLKPREVLVQFKSRTASPLYSVVVSDPNRALELIKEHLGNK